MENSSRENESEMAPNIDEIKAPPLTEFDENEDDIDFDGLHSDIDNINGVLDLMEERADSILEAIQNLAREIHEDKVNVAEELLKGAQITEEQEKTEPESK